MGEQQAVRIHKRPKLARSSLVVGWSEDAGRLGPKVIEYVNGKLGGEVFAEIEPDDFFSLGGISVEDDVAIFPECKFYLCEKQSLVFCSSSPPRSEWYRFLDLVLAVAEEYCNARELYTFGAMISMGPHSVDRDLLAVTNFPLMKDALAGQGLEMEMDYETPPGQRPTLNSFLLWVAQRRRLTGASLWVPIPFYLVSTEDPRAWKRVVQFFDRRFDLGLDLSDLDQEIARQDQKIGQLRMMFPDIDNCLRKLENGLASTQDENERMVKEVEELFRRRGAPGPDSERRGRS